MAKFHFKNYFEVTPKRLRKIGVLIAMSGVSIGAYLQANQTQIIIDFPALAHYSKYFPYLAVVLGYFGKEATNFFKEDDSTTETPKVD